MSPIDTSYEIICAADLSDPRNGYFELDAHPPIITPYTSKEEIAKTNKRATLISDRTQPSFNGITAQARIAITKDIRGAKKNTGLSAPAGIIISLKTSLSMSAPD